LLARAREDAASRGGAVAVTDSSQLPVTRTSHRAAPRVQRIPPTTWLALAAALAFVAALGGWLVSRAHVVQLESDLVAVRTLAASRLDSLNATLDALTASEVRVVNLTATGPRPPSAQMFWNQRSSRWTLFAHYLAPPAAGKTYQVWLVTTANEKISAGTFTPDSTGHATLQADYALAGGPASLQTVAVTLEPDGGVPQPTGPIILAGNATR
jgi:anti-sigma-K factor RskA